LSHKAFQKHNFRKSTMRASMISLATALLFATPTALMAKAETKATQSAPLIAYDEFKLPNGLRVIVHSDRKAPVVAVSIWYHVGSKDERPGLKGFAHLFEHLMFNGSENFNDEWFRPMEEIGASEVNGTTWFDRTNYYQTVPTAALERVLFMESDRMGHLLGAIDQKKLDEQRGVVLNEKRQGDNEPYGKLEYNVLAGLFPEGHPYRWSTIGSEEDLNAAKLDDVKAWFRTAYGPSNAVLVLSGDIDVATAKTLTLKYFGDIAPGTPLSKRQAWVPERRENTRDVIFDRVPQTRVSRNWAVPGYRERDKTLLELAASIFGGGKTSRLYKALVYDAALATSASMSVQEQEIVSIAELEINVRPGSDAAAAERLAEETLRIFLDKGPTAEELARIKTVIRAAVLRSLERVNGKASSLASGALYADNPNHTTQELAWVEAATPIDVRDAARRWLGNGWHQVSVLPFGALQAAASGVDRKKGLPDLAKMPELVFPQLEQAQLSNGVKVVLAPRPGTPLASVALLFDAGSAGDPAAQPGLSNLTLNMLDEGAGGRDALQLAAAADSLGAVLRAGSSLDSSSASLGALVDKLDPSLALLADIVQRPAFASEDLERLRRNQLASISQEKAQPQALALRLLPPALYGSNHPYGKPLTGSGTEASIKAITTNDLKDYAARWLRPDTMTIYAGGGISMEQLKPLLEKHFGSWKAASVTRGSKPSLDVTPAKAARVAIIDKPGAEQSFILAGRIGSRGNSENYFATSIANDVLGGAFTARINMNLREDKHWSYGAFSFMPDAQGPRPWLMLAPVQTDKTLDSLRELVKEVSDFKTSKPATADELDRQIKSNVRSLPGAFETVSSLVGSMVSNAAMGRAPDFVREIKQRYESVTAKDVATSAAQEFRTDDLLWVVVGDRSKIEAGIRGLGLGPVEIWNEDGAVVK
jgi:zinc protease